MFKRFFKNTSPNTKNILSLVSANIFGQVIPLVVAPINSRIYAPEDYGALGLYMSIVSLIAVIATLRLQIAIVLPKSDEEGNDLFVLCSQLGLLFALLTFLVLLVMQLFSLNPPIIEDLHYFKWFLPVSILITAVTSASSVLLTRLRAFKVYSRILIFTTIFSSALSILLGLLIKGPTGLIVGYLVGQLLVCILMCKMIAKKTNLNIKVGPDEWKMLLSRYKKFPLFSLPTDFLFTVIKQLPIYFIVLISGKRELGMFNMSNRLLGVPIDTVASSFGNIFMQEAARQYNDHGRCDGLFKRTFKKLFWLSIIPFLLLGLTAPFIFDVFLGSQWIEAGVFSQYMVLMFFLKFISVPLIFMYSIANRQHEDMINHIVLFFLLLGLFLIGQKLELSIYVILLAYSVVYALMYSFMLVRAYKFSKGVKV